MNTGFSLWPRQDFLFGSPAGNLRQQESQKQMRKLIKVVWHNLSGVWITTTDSAFARCMFAVRARDKKLRNSLQAGRFWFSQSGSSNHQYFSVTYGFPCFLTVSRPLLRDPHISRPTPVLHFRLRRNRARDYSGPPVRSLHIISAGPRVSASEQHWLCSPVQPVIEQRRYNATSHIVWRWELM